MPQKKIRGYNRKLRQLEQWRKTHLSTDLIALLRTGDYHYAKLHIYPWNGFSRSTSIIREPFGKIKAFILQAIIDIYENWNNQLEKLDEPYYLKIWFFDPRFSNSQVVCAVNKRINYYENLFHRNTEKPEVTTSFVESIQKKSNPLKWECRLDEDFYDNTFLGEEDMYSSIKEYNNSKKWFDHLLQQPHRTTIVDNPASEIQEIYSFKKGLVWINKDNEKGN